MNSLARRLLAPCAASALVLLAGCTADDKSPAVQPLSTGTSGSASILSASSDGIKPVTFGSVADCFKDSNTARQLFERDKCLYGENRVADVTRESQTSPPARPGQWQARNDRDAASRKAWADYDQAAAALYLRTF